MTYASIVNDVKNARQSGAAYSLPAALSDGNLAAAYSFQSALVELLQVEGTVGPLAGYKIAVNGKPQMAHFGVSEPVSGALFVGEIATTPVSLPAANFQTLTVEPEIAVILGSGVATLNENPSDQEVMSCIESYLPAIEIIDMRGCKAPETSLAAAVSLNVFNQGCVLGTERVAPSALKLEDITASLAIDGEVVGSATNNAPQHPLQAIKWLASHLRQRGLALSKGMVIMCGTHIPMYTVPAGSKQIRIEMTGLGSAELLLDYCIICQ